MSNKVMLIPCSGMGKVFGLIARESVLQTVKQCPENTATACLAYVVTGDEEAKKLIANKKCITVDGCSAMCAAKNAELAGGLVQEKVRVIETYRKHKGAYTGTATQLTDKGWQVVDEIVEDIVKKLHDINQ